MVGRWLPGTAVTVVERFCRVGHGGAEGGIPGSAMARSGRSRLEVSAARRSAALGIVIAFLVVDIALLHGFACPSVDLIRFAQPHELLDSGQCRFISAGQCRAMRFQNRRNRTRMGYRRATLTAEGE